MKKSMTIAALSLLMTAAVGCGHEDGPDLYESHEVDTETQALGAGCTLLRPLSWTVRGVTCLERPTTSLPLAHGQPYTAHAGHGGIFGQGYTTVRCNNGRIEVEVEVCRRSGDF